jgi:hypothetical protein
VRTFKPAPKDNSRQSIRAKFSIRRAVSIRNGEKIS